RLRPHLEAGEEEAPLGTDRLRVGLPAAILLRDILLVGERDALEAVHPRIFYRPGGLAATGQAEVAACTDAEIDAFPSHDRRPLRSAACAGQRLSLLR